MKLNGTSETEGKKMITVNAKNVEVGSTVVIDGHERKVIQKNKAWKAPEYLITFEWSGGQKVTRSYHVNTKFSVCAKVGA